MSNLLVVMILLPLVGALVVALLGSSRPTDVRWVTLGTTLATLVVSLVVVGKFQTPATEQVAKEIMLPQMQLQVPWLQYGLGDGGTAKIEAYLGIDGLSLGLVALTTILMVSSVLVSWTAVTNRVAQFYAWLLILEAGLLGVFCAFDLILFYVFFEFTLIPLFFLIGIWGGAKREYAAGKFFIYTLTGSMLTLVGLIAFVLTVHHHSPQVFTFSIPELAREVRTQLASGNGDVLASWKHAQFWIFLALFAGFAIKVPLFPFHTWLPLAHVEAPTAGSVLLAGLLLKLGSYGFLRLAMPLLPLAVADIGVPLVATLSVVGILYGALCALGQKDIKRMVAYSSVSHLGFCMLGLFALNAEGISGGMMQMLNHGLSTAGLFLLVGMLYERLHSRQFEDMGGLATRIPIFACFLILMSLSSMGLPGLNGFIGEMLSLIGMFRAQPIYAVVGALGIILGAWYLLNMLQQVLFGPRRELPAHDHLHDLNTRETLALAPIAILCLVIGVFPQPLLRTMQPEVSAIAAIYEKSADATVVASVPLQPQTEKN